MERVTRPQEFKTKVATNTKHAIKTTTITTTTTTTITAAPATTTTTTNFNSTTQLHKVATTT